MKSEINKETSLYPKGDDGATDLHGPAGGDGVAAPVGGEGVAEALGLPEQLEAALRRAEENYDLYLRERAELENFRKRTARDRADASRFAVEPLARDILVVVDNLERALDHARSSGEAASVVEGVDLVLKGALEALQRHGVTRVEAVGQVFDPALHEALAQVASDDVAANNVVEQFVPGYRLHDRLLRAAQVSVSTGVAPEKDQ